MRELALDHAAGQLPDAVYLERLGALRESKETLATTAGGSVTAEVALAWLRALSETWTDADVPEAKADVSTPSTSGSPSQGGPSCRSG
jgi:hypothetical protein